MPLMSVIVGVVAFEVLYIEVYPSRMKEMSFLRIDMHLGVYY